MLLRTWSFFSSSSNLAVFVGWDGCVFVVELLKMLFFRCKVPLKKVGGKFCGSCHYIFFKHMAWKFKLYYLGGRMKW